MPIQFVRHDDVIEVQVNVSELPLTVQKIRDAMNEAGYGRCQLLMEQVSNFIADYEVIQSDIRLNKVSAGTQISRRIAVRRDAELKIIVAADQMSAVAEITAAWGGKPISANDVVKIAQEQGVSFGFQKDNIIQLVSQSSRAEPGVVHKAVIAIGRPMKPGENARFEPLVDGMNARSNRPMARDDERVDLRDFGVIPSVHHGEAIVRRLPPTNGVDGVSVVGEVTPAQPGQNIDWQVGEGTEISPQDPDLLIALKDGMPRLLEAGATVDEVYALKKVDLSTGHIIFKGSVIVNGDVTESMKIVAGGNIFIKGLVDGSLIESGGDINIGGSVIGHQMGHSAEEKTFSTVVRAKGDVKCALAQYVRFECGGELQVMKQLNHCSVSAKNVIAGQPDKLSGKIIGGDFLLETSLKAGTVGSPSESLLLVDMNRLVMPIIEKQQALRDSIQAIKREMEEIRLMIEQMKAQDQTPAMQQQIQMFVEDFETQKAIAVAMIADVKELEIERQAKLADCVIMVKQQLFAGVEIKIGTETLPVRREFGASKIGLVDGKIKIDPLV